MTKGMPRADAEGFRYKRLRDNFTGDENADLLIREEFENIATRVGEFVGSRLSEVASSAQGAAGTGISGKANPDTDKLVGVDEGDPEADFLKYKIIAGPGITIGVQPGRRNGLALVVSVDPRNMTVWHLFDFNTWVDNNGAVLPQFLPDDGSGTRKKNPKSHILIINHTIPHPHTHVSIYRPEEVRTQPTTTDYHPPDGLFDGDDRGRYEIRWEVLERRPFRTVVRFHQPEYGTILISGPGAV